MFQQLSTSSSALDVDGRAVTPGLLRAIPKAETHVHLEGSIEAGMVKRFARENGRPVPDGGSVDTPGVPTLTTFLGYLDWQCGFVATATQLAEIAYRFAERQGRSGIRYTDVIVNPAHWPFARAGLGAFFEALADGFAEAERDGLPPVGICVSLLRSQSAIQASDLVEWLIYNRPRGVHALSVDGDEALSGRTGMRFQDAFEKAAQAGLHRTVHAGESSGPEGVWDAIQMLGAERIDHGVRAAEDPELVRFLVDTQIPLGVCPSSNFDLGIYDHWQAHPLAHLWDAGVLITVNTDDPELLSTRLELEWMACAAALGWTWTELARLARNSISASFLADDAKRALLTEIEDSVLVGGNR